MTPIPQCRSIHLDQFATEDGRIFPVNDTTNTVLLIKKQLRLYLDDFYLNKHLKNFSNKPKEIAAKDILKPKSIPSKTFITIDLDFFKPIHDQGILVDQINKLTQVINNPEKVFTYYYTIETMRYFLICGVITLIVSAVLFYMKIEHNYVFSFHIHHLALSGVGIVSSAFLIRKFFKSHNPHIDTEYNKLWDDILKHYEAKPKDEILLAALEIEEDATIFFTHDPNLVFGNDPDGDGSWAVFHRPLTNEEYNEKPVQIKFAEYNVEPKRSPSEIIANLDEKVDH